MCSTSRVAGLPSGPRCIRSYRPPQPHDVLGEIGPLHVRPRSTISQDFSSLATSRSLIVLFLFVQYVSVLCARRQSRYTRSDSPHGDRQLAQLSPKIVSHQCHELRELILQHDILDQLSGRAKLPRANCFRAELSLAVCPSAPGRAGGPVRRDLSAVGEDAVGLVDPLPNLAREISAVAASSMRL